MKKSIVVKKAKPVCKLEGLTGVNKHKIDAYWFENVNDIEPTLELGYACTSAGDNGAINVWKTDAGIIRSELMRHCVTIEKRTFASYAEAEKCVSDWLERINYNKKISMKQTVQERAEEMCEAWGMEDDHGYSVKDTFKVGFVQGANWQEKRSPWINANERLPEENENIIIMCEHGAIFNGTYSKGTWFCMDGYLHDTYKGNPLYSSMTGIPPLWEPIAWMPIPKFNE